MKRLIFIATIARVASMVPQVMADDINLARWQELAVIANELQTEEVRKFVPTNLQPVSSKEALFQQMVNYQVKRAAINSPIRVLDSQWAGQVGQTVEGKKTTYDIRPVDTKAWVNYRETVTAAMTYKVFSHQTELSLSPSQKFMGLGVAVSHVMSTDDRRDMLVVKMDW